jgi:hypothetical protein
MTTENCKQGDQVNNEGLWDQFTRNKGRTSSNLLTIIFMGQGTGNTKRDTLSHNTLAPLHTDSHECVVNDHFHSRPTAGQIPVIYICLHNIKILYWFHYTYLPNAVILATQKK